MQSTVRQELPPPGGYNPLNFGRRPAKQFMNPYLLVLGYFVTSFGSLYLAKKSIDRFERQQVEQRSSMFALLPMLTAERDRAYLKQVRKNREEEAELMKNVEGWEVGTWFGKPPYNSQGPDTLLPPNHYEFYAHAHANDFFKYTLFRSYS
ncbi:NADH dehydrogenase (ubiquinone) B16.6 subunit [Lycorma delicatula]|uniref:NADH dehydrogenase (ubiquinone) B16.6 subunit n=1 Tax=Lycorma delicatula TaxID=130591 RepID=UPI003F518392